MKAILVRNLRAANDALAATNRDTFARHGILALNLMGSPGAGKTSLLEATLARLAPFPGHCGVIEGDIATTRDGERIAAHGVPVVQLNTDGACHLDAGMIAQGLEQLLRDGFHPVPRTGSFLFIENVGNLVCPAEFDLGAHHTVVVYSVTEGPDKPEKYPLAFQRASAVVLTKVDLLPHLGLGQEDFLSTLTTCAPQATVFPVSAWSGTGMDAWCRWLRQQLAPVAAWPGPEA